MSASLRERLTDAALWWVRRQAKDSNIVAHGVREMRLAGMQEDDPENGPNKWIARATHNLLAVFSLEGHSGGSAGYATKLFATLSSFEPWGPLTGDDAEWHEVGDGVWQNKRCSRVFKGADGRAYDIDGTVYRYPDGCCVTTGRFGRHYIEFPYTPATQYVDLDEDGEIRARASELAPGAPAR